MKPATLSFSHRLLSLLLAALVLTASVGLTVRRHTCRISGRSTAHLLLPGLAGAAGCGPAAAVPELRDGCCDVAAQEHKLSSPAGPALLAKVLVPTPLLLALPPPVMPRWPAAAGAEATAAALGVRWFAADSSPPASGRAVLLRGRKLVV